MKWFVFERTLENVAGLLLFLMFAVSVAWWLIVAWWEKHK